MITLRTALNELMRADWKEQEGIYPHELFLLNKFLHPQLCKFSTLQYFEKPHKLREKIKSIYESGDYFYIGYTEGKFAYVLAKKPDNLKWTNFARRFTGEPRKVMTYYATADRETNEETLIEKYIVSCQCLNGKGSTKTDGFVYVVEYKKPILQDLLESLARLVSTPEKDGVEDLNAVIEKGQAYKLLRKLQGNKVEVAKAVTLSLACDMSKGRWDITAIVLEIRDIARKWKRKDVLSQVTIVLRELYWLKVFHEHKNPEVQKLLECSSQQTFFVQLINTWWNPENTSHGAESKKKEEDLLKPRVEWYLFTTTLLQMEGEHVETLLKELAQAP